ncbi:SRPBCC domain-containing protein [Aliiglaciecola sp. NS0011-25]|uniref:SRPBCC domain-containing protein n=1 Tax=Aliiglaciecola sp. NS0011-25 TaxID=3127654 RepID=UPI00310B5682
MSQNKTKSVHKIFIAAPIDKVWQQLTKTDGLQAQFFNARLDTPGLEQGAAIRMRTGKNGKYTSVVGEVLEFDPPYTYSHSFKFTSLDDPYCKVTYKLKEVDGGTEFTLINEDMPVATKTAKYMEQGVPFILNTLKGVVEHGKPPFKYQLMLFMIGALSFTVPSKCKSEHWPL